MPPMKAAAAKKAPGKPSAPKKPTSRSKTGNSACSQAASNWQLAIRGKAPLDPDTYKTLGKCRAMSRASKSADDRADMGYNLSEQGRTALKGRLQKRFDQGLITQKSRQDRLKTLLAQRKERQATSPAPASKPIDKAASLVAAVRQKPGYENTRLNKADDYKRGVREKLISTFVQDAIAGRRVPRKILDDMRDVRNSWISEAGLMSARNDTRLPDYNTRPTFYMRPPVSLKGSALRNIETKASNVRKFWGVGEDEEGRMDTTPLLHKAQASAAARKAGKKHKAYKQLNATPAPAPAPALAKESAVTKKTVATPIRDDYSDKETQRIVRERQAISEFRDMLSAEVGRGSGGAEKRREGWLKKYTSSETKHKYVAARDLASSDYEKAASTKLTTRDLHDIIDDGVNSGVINSKVAPNLKRQIQRYRGEPIEAAPAPAPAPAKFSRGGQLAPGRGTVERAIVANALITGRKPAQIKGEYENAGNNVIMNPAATPRERVKQKKLIALLNTYERSYAGQWNLPKPPKRDEHAHGAALLASGLTGDGLMRARFIAGKYATGKPGIIAVKPPAPAPAPAPAAKQYSPVSRPSVDHSFLSPSGRVSKRSKEWAIKKTSETLFGPGGMPHPQLPKQPTEQEVLRRQAAELRDMASRGLKPRAYKKKADELEAKANSLDLPPAPAPAPAKFSRGGQLAPGRGTEERSDLARRLRHFKRVTDTYVSVSKNSHVGELREVAPGIRQRAPFNPTVARKVGLSLGGNLTEYEKTRRKARLSTKKANKLAAPSKR